MIPKYMTKGIQDRIPLDLQILMWQMYDRCKEEMERTDYLHVFQLKELEGEVLNQEIIHQQEIPEYERTYVINIDYPMTEKVYVIESEDYVTMLLANEY
ncbi:MAG: DUF960 family protein [Turicibacter sp.]|nr:DUF960 family protein [Turicibacter sp.]